jgi:hypothetical protein
MSKREVIQALDFGHIIAETEREHIAGLFVETTQWKDIESGRKEIISGNKGFGKSTIYQLMAMSKPAFAARNVTVLLAENLTDDRAFLALTEAGSLPNEKEFEAFWKLYFLTIAGNALNNEGEQQEQAAKVVSHLKDADLIVSDFSLHTILRRVLKYVMKVFGNPIKSVEMGATVEPSTGMPKATIRFDLSEISAKEKSEGVVDVNELLALLNRYLDAKGRRIWILLDRLDGVFGSNEDLELMALRTLLRVYLHKFKKKPLGLRLFLRADAVNALAEHGSRELTHALEFKTDLRWEVGELSKLIALRLASSPVLLDSYKVTAVAIKSDMIARSQLINSLFGGTFGAGTKAFPHILENLEDGNGQVTPRDLILFFKTCQEFELSRLDNGAPEHTGKGLFHPQTAQNAFKEVASCKLTQSTYAEYPSLVRFIKRLPAISTPVFSRRSMAQVWGVKPAEAVEIAAKLTELGVLKTGNAGQGYSISRVYKTALNG